MYSSEVVCVRRTLKNRKGSNTRNVRGHSVYTSLSYLKTTLKCTYVVVDMTRMNSTLPQVAGSILDVGTSPDPVSSHQDLDNMAYMFLSHYHSSTPHRNHSCKFPHVNVFGRLLHNQLQSIKLLCHNRLCHNVRVRDKDKMLVNDRRVLVFTTKHLVF